MTPTVAELRRVLHGAPDTLRSRLRELADLPSLPRISRREYARALAAVEPPGLPQAGVVPFVVVAPGSGTGRVYRAIATDGSRPDLTPVPRALDEAVTTWLSATFPEVGFAGLHLHVSGPPPGAVWDGRSCELALAVAGLSWALRLPLAPDVALSGCLGVPGSIEPANHAADKQDVLHRDLPSARLVEADLALQALLSAVLPGWEEARSQHADAQPERWAREASDALTRRALDQALQLADRALSAAADPATHARAAWVRGSTLLHLGRTPEGLATLESARTLLPSWESHADDPAEDLVQEELEAYVIVALLDAGRPRAAYELGTTTLTRLDRSSTRGRRWRSVALQVAGSTHRAAIALGALGDALRLLQTWNLGVARLHDQLARALGDLAEVHRRAGRLPDARQALTEARASLPDAQDHGGATARFLTLFEARIDADQLRPFAPPRSGGPIWPELGFRLLATRSGDESLTELYALPAVRQSPVLQSVVASEAAWHVLHDLPSGAVFEAVRHDLAQASCDDNSLTALWQRLVESPQRDDLVELRRRAPYG